MSRRFLAPPAAVGLAIGELHRQGYADVQHDGWRQTKLGPAQVFRAVDAEGPCWCLVGRTDGDRLDVRRLPPEAIEGGAR